MEKSLLSSRELYFEVCKNIKNGADSIDSYKGYFEKLDFLYKAPQLGDFVPVNSKGEPMEKPETFQNDYNGNSVERDLEKDLREEYQKALDNVLFKGWEITKGYLWNKKKYIAEAIRLDHTDMKFLARYKTYEDIIKAGIPLIPTEALKKQGI